MDKYEKEYGNLCAKCRSSSCCLINNTSSINYYDIVRLSIGLNISIKEFLEKYTVDWFEDYDYEQSKKFLAKQTEKGHPKDLTWIAHKTPYMEGVNVCTFLNWNEEAKSMRCSIYEFRPDVCRDWHTPDCDDSNVTFAMNDMLNSNKDFKPFFKSTESVLNYVKSLLAAEDYKPYDLKKYQLPIEQKLLMVLKEATKQNYSYDFGYKVAVPDTDKIISYTKFKCTDDDGYNNHYYPSILKDTSFGVKRYDNTGKKALYKAIVFFESVLVLDSYLNELDRTDREELVSLLNTIIYEVCSYLNIPTSYEKKCWFGSVNTSNSSISKILTTQNNDGFWLKKNKNLKTEIYNTIKESVQNTWALLSFLQNCKS